MRQCDEEGAWHFRQVTVLLVRNSFFTSKTGMPSLYPVHVLDELPVSWPGPSSIKIFALADHDSSREHREL